MKRLTCSLPASLLLLSLLPAGQAFAQDASPTARAAQRAARPFKDATMTSVARVPEISVLLTGTKDDKAVEANLGFGFGNWTLDGKLKGPLDESGPDTSLATIAGLTNGTTFDLGVSYLHWTPTADVAHQNAVCLEFLRSIADDFEKSQKIQQAGSTGGCTWSKLPKDSFRQQYLRAGSDTRREAVCRAYAQSVGVNPAEFKCSPANLPEESLFDRYDRTTEWALPVQAGIRYSRGRNKFKWADPTTGDAHSAVESPWEISAGVNYLLDMNGRDVAVSVEIARQSAFEEQPARDVCQPLSSSPTTLTCRSLAFGAYTPTERTVLTGSVRKWYGNAAIDMRYNWDATNRQHLVETPIYFLAADGKGLTGGIVPSWSSDKEDGDGGWTIRAFIGDVLSVWPRAR